MGRGLWCRRTARHHAYRGVVAGGQDGRPRESSVEANLGRVPLDKLTRFLQDIERSPGVVRVRRLRVRKSSDNKDKGEHEDDD